MFVARYFSPVFLLLQSFSSPNIADDAFQKVWGLERGQRATSCHHFYHVLSCPG
uniref:Hypothetical secreted protein n=1 Tax=Ornithodoros coriaceus TaxID=92741 RepID=B2D2E7_ORNCO|nr:hypothetical secreted protein precursor [Ornithodoros coriaceus]